MLKVKRLENAEISEMTSHTIAEATRYEDDLAGYQYEISRLIRTRDIAHCENVELQSRYDELLKGMQNLIKLIDMLEEMKLCKPHTKKGYKGMDETDWVPHLKELREQKNAWLESQN
jgi:hypothetical protein